MTDPTDQTQKMLSVLLEKSDAVNYKSPYFRAILEQQDSAMGVEPAKFNIKKDGMAAEYAAYIVRQQLQLDGRETLNLASFVTTCIDPEAIKLCQENLTKNLADNDEYPSLIKLHARCIGILGNLWNNFEDEEAVGSATTGSSEAIQLGGLAMKRRWEKARKDKGLSTDKPNVVYASNAHVSIEKFARYFDVEARVLPVYKEHQYGPSLEDLKNALDENTIGVYIIQGSTYTGHFVDVASMANVLDDFEKETGNDIPIHIDGASGAFVAPFCFPDLKWDFRIPRVKSINASGHKFGLAPVGLGWIVFRDRKYLPEALQFNLNYLGGSELTFTLNFSRPGHPVIAQYYVLIKHGFDGFKGVHSTALKNARMFSVALEQTGNFEVLTDIHRPKGTFFCDNPSIQAMDSTTKNCTEYNPGLPVVAFRFSEHFRKKHPEVPLEALSYMLRYHGYIVPCYSMPEKEKGTEVMRVVVNPGLTIDIITTLVLDIAKCVDRLKHLVSKQDFSIENLKLTFNVLTKVTLADNEEVESAKDWKHIPC